MSHEKKEHGLSIRFYSGCCLYLKHFQFLRCLVTCNERSLLHNFFIIFHNSLFIHHHQHLPQDTKPLALSFPTGVSVDPSVVFKVFPMYLPPRDVCFKSLLPYEILFCSVQVVLEFLFVLCRARCLIKHTDFTCIPILTYSMVQDIWETGCHSACQKNHTFLWNPKVHYRVRTSPPLDPILSQLNPVCPIDPYFPKVHLNVILPPTPRSSQSYLYT
jgi:hypothetical protein